MKSRLSRVNYYVCPSIYQMALSITLLTRNEHLSKSLVPSTFYNNSLVHNLHLYERLRFAE